VIKVRDVCLFTYKQQSHEYNANKTFSGTSFLVRVNCVSHNPEFDKTEYTVEPLHFQTNFGFNRFVCYENELSFEVPM
jgi:hypothetical protein